MASSHTEMVCEHIPSTFLWNQMPPPLTSALRMSSSSFCVWISAFSCRSRCWNIFVALANACGKRRVSSQRYSEGLGVRVRVGLPLGIWLGLGLKVQMGGNHLGYQSVRDRIRGVVCEHALDLSPSYKYPRRFFPSLPRTFCAVELEVHFR